MILVSFGPSLAAWWSPARPSCWCKSPRSLPIGSDSSPGPASPGEKTAQLQCTAGLPMTYTAKIDNTYIIYTVYIYILCNKKCIIYIYITDVCGTVWMFILILVNTFLFGHKRTQIKCTHTHTLYIYIMNYMLYLYNNIIYIIATWRSMMFHPTNQPSKCPKKHIAPLLLRRASHQASLVQGFVGGSSADALEPRIATLISGGCHSNVENQHC